MERYKSNKKIKTKESTFSILKNFFRDAKRTENEFLKISDRLDAIKDDENSIEEYKELSLKADKLLNKLNAIDKAKSKIKKEFAKIGTIALSSTIVITGFVSGLLYGIHAKRESNVLDALSVQGYSIENYYKQSPDELDELVSSPEMVRNLALDTLKAKLANHYNVSSKDDFTIYNNTVYDGKVNPDKTVYSVSYKGNEVCSYVYTSDSYGNILNISKDTMPDEIKASINNIVRAQEDPNSITKAYAALRSVNSNDTDKSIKTNLPAYLPGIEPKGR